MRYNAIGIICEFNPIHNGHIYFLEEIKRRYPEHVIVLVLNGYILQRGELSVISKEDKTKLALDHGVDLVIEHPVMYGTQSADVFAESAVRLLASLRVEKLIFGSESDNLDMIKKIANEHLYNPEFDIKVKEYLKKGESYPRALALATNIEGFESTPNDILGISYTKAILKNKFKMEIETIKRTNDFHDNDLDTNIVSASNIRKRLLNNEDISKYVPEDVIPYINTIDKKTFYAILKLKIITDKDLSSYLDVTEGIDYRIVRIIRKHNNLDDFIEDIKNKRFTYTRLNRMFIHILLGITKKDAKCYDQFYLKILGFTTLGRRYLNVSKKYVSYIHNATKYNNIYKYELKAADLYQILAAKDVFKFEKDNKPVKKIV